MFSDISSFTSETGLDRIKKLQREEQISFEETSINPLRDWNNKTLLFPYWRRGGVQDLCLIGIKKEQALT
jgi:hypothetical protein